MVLHVHLLELPFPVSLEGLLAALDPAVQLTWGPDLPVPANYEILIAGRPERVHLTASPALHTLIIPWAGLPQSTRALLLEFPNLAVHNLHHNSAQVAEMALALLLAAAKALVPADRIFRTGDWSPRHWDPNPSVMLEGRTALVLGYGAVGQRIARLCRGLGMDVCAVRRDPSRPHALGDVVYPLAALPELLPRAAALLIALPETPETVGIIGERELVLLPSDAVLVNVGRASIVVEAALYHALRQGRLRAAGLDVWYRSPREAEAGRHLAPSAYPFQELDNVVLSPHRAGGLGGAETEPQRLADLARLLNAAARGAPLPNRVDVVAGY